MWKKLVSLNLALLMVFAMVPVHPAAADTGSDNTVYIDDGETVTPYTGTSHFDVTANSLTLYLDLPELEKEGAAASAVSVDDSTVDYYPGRTVSVDPDGDRTITVTWQEVDGLYIRYVDGDGLSACIQSYGEGGSVTLAEQNTFLSGDGERTVCWLTVRDRYSGGIYTPGTAYDLTAPVTLYGMWGAGVITFHDTDDGSRYSPGGSFTQTYYSGVLARTLTRDPRYDSGTGLTTGYEFEGWNSAPDGSGDNFASTSAAITAPPHLYPLWYSWEGDSPWYRLRSGSGAVLASGKDAEHYPWSEDVLLTLPTPLRQGEAAFWVDESAQQLLLAGTTVHPGAGDSYFPIPRTDYGEADPWYDVGINLPGSYSASAYSLASASNLSLTLRQLVPPELQAWEGEVVTGATDGTTVYPLTAPMAEICAHLDPQTGGAVLLESVTTPVEGSYLLLGGNGGVASDGLDYAVCQGLSFDSGTADVIPQCPFVHPEGLVFIGWYADNTWYMPGQPLSLLSDGAVLTARWARYGRFLFHYTDSYGSYTAQHIDQNFVPYRSGCLLAGWNTEEDGSGDWYYIPSDIAAYEYRHGTVVDLYAQWIELPTDGTGYLIVHGPFADRQRADVVYANGDGTYTLPGEDRFGDDFRGFSSSDGFDGWAEELTPPGTTLSASSGSHWYPIYGNWSVTYHGSGATTADGSGIRTYIKTTTWSNLSLPSVSSVFSNRDNCGTFLNWNTDEDGSGQSYEPYTSLPEGRYDLYAQWAHHISLTPTEATLTLGDTLRLTAALSDEAAGTTVSWTSHDSAVAAVDSTGLVTAVGGGTTSIEASIYYDGTWFTAKCTVTVPASVTVHGPDSMWTDNNRTVALTAEVSPLLDDQSVVWSTSDETVATVDENGVVTPTGTGGVIIFASASDGSRAGFELYFTANLYWNRTLSTLAVGSSSLLQASASGSLADQTVSWTSSDPSVAAVDSTGLVTALAPGRVTLRATASDGTFITCALSCYIHYDTDISPNREKISLLTGETPYELYVWTNGYQDVSSDLRWTVSPGGILSVAGAALSDEEAAEMGAAGALVVAITPLAPGNAVITFTGRDGNSARVSVSVTAFGLELGRSTLLPGETTTVTAFDSQGNAPSLSWTSSDPSVASVDGSGVITALSNGTAVITGTDSGGNAASASLSVVSIRIEAERTVVAPGSTLPLTAVVSPLLEDKSVVWKSGSEDAFTVDENGLVTGISDGWSSYVYAYASDGSYDRIRISVQKTFDYVRPKVLTLSPGSSDWVSLLLCGVEDPGDLSVTVGDDSVVSLGEIWSDGDDEWRWVEIEVTGLKTGVTTLTLSANGETLVIPASVSELEISAADLTLVPGETASLSVTRDGVPVSVVWSSDREAVATVDGTGTVTAVDEGSALIYATADDGTFLVCDVRVDRFRIALDGQPCPGYISLGVGSSRQLSVVTAPGLSGVSVTWTVDDESIASIGGDGLITGISAGCTLAELSISYDGGSISTGIEIEVVPCLELSAEEITLSGVSRAYLDVSWLYGETLSWEVSNEGVITVEEWGEIAYPSPEGSTPSLTGLSFRITAVGSGFSTVTFTTSGGQSAACTVCVPSFLVVPSELELLTGDRAELSAYALTGGSEVPVVWSSEDEEVASVDSDGTVTALDAGSTVIRATAADGTYCLVDVTVTTIRFADDIPTALGVGQKIRLDVLLASTLTDLSLTWTSSDEDIASVDQDGTVTGISPGSVRIYARNARGERVSVRITVVDSPAVTFDPGSGTVTVSGLSRLYTALVAFYRGGQMISLESGSASSFSVLLPSGSGADCVKVFITYFGRPVGSPITLAIP